MSVYVASCRTYVFYQKFIDLSSVFTLYSKCLSLLSVFSKCHLAANACPEVAEEYHVVLLVVSHVFESF